MAAHGGARTWASRRARIRAALTPLEWRRAAALVAVVAGLHVLGVVLLLVTAAPRGLLAIGVTAYTLGLRHAFDADHVAAIDATTRKLMSDGRRPLSVGFCFSLGHSTIVFALALLLALGFRGLGGDVAHAGSPLHSVTGLVGTTVSGAFLSAIGLLNLAVLVGIVRVARRTRDGDLDERELEAELDRRGLANRLSRRVGRSIREPWQMYPLGMLFGLGFDTATEVALLVLAAGAALGQLSLSAILCLPILFAAGMSLLDTLDGIVMRFAYGWAFAQPLRKLYYNLTVTGLSVAVALVIGTVELLSIATEKLGLRGGLWDTVARLDLNLVGYAIVGLFVVTWVVALVVWRVGRIEERWRAPARAQAR
jgi:high-affinity nickel-transport protein